jgi:hypothetical protein
LRVGELAGVLMGPCVARNLMTFGMHSLKPCFSMASPRNCNRNSYFDDCRIDGRGIIDLPLAEVVSRDEEGGFGTVALFFVRSAIRSEGRTKGAVPKPSAYQVGRSCRCTGRHQM